MIENPELRPILARVEKVTRPNEDIEPSPEDVRVIRFSFNKKDYEVSLSKSGRSFVEVKDASDQILSEWFRRVRIVYQPSILVQAYQDLHPQNWIECSSELLLAGGPAMVRKAIP
eukprot:gene14192-biopygen1899